MVREKDRVWLGETTEKVKRKMRAVSERSCRKIPYTSINGVHDDRSGADKSFSEDLGIYWWTNGFWGGMMWMMYHETGEQRFADIARFSEEKLDYCLQDFYGLHHDVGFMYLPTAVADYRLTGSPDSRRRGLHAANILAARFNPAGKFIRAWNDREDAKDDRRGWAIIDCLLNIPLLYWAGEETKDPRFKHVATMHADTVMKHFVRADGSVRHIVEFDTETGEMIRDYGGQGYETGSSWTRGQTWGMYGFLMSYLHTGKQEYLDTARKIAHYFMANIPEDGLIPVDFRQPAEPFWYDDTAGAIAACGLLELSKTAGEYEKDIYYRAAVKLLKALCENHCDFSEDTDSILLKCTGSYHEREHEYPIIYGDFFFMEALFKLKGNDYFMW